MYGLESSKKRERVLHVRGYSREEEHNWPLLYFPKSFFCWNVSAIKTVLSCFSFRSLGRKGEWGLQLFGYYWLIWNIKQHDTKTTPSFLFNGYYSEWKLLWNMARVNTKDIKEVDQNSSVLSWWEVFTSIKTSEWF